MLPRLLARTAAAEHPALVERVRRMMEATPVAGILGAIGALRDRPDSVSLLPALAGIPTMVIAGDDDQITPRDRAQAMADAIPGARLAVLSGAGHLAPIECPEATTSLLVDFLAGIGRPA
jgi:pimeloyl-ACP methyl ester carboxylesterase